MENLLVPAIIKNRFKAFNKKVNICTYQINEKLTEEYSNVFDTIVVFPFEKIDIEFLEHFLIAKTIIVAGTGTENIDFKHAKSIHTNIINLTGINTSAVVEWIIHNILEIKRNFSNTFLCTSSLNQFDKLDYCNSIQSKFTIGFLGCGRIPQTVLKTLSFMGELDCMIYDPYITNNKDPKFVSSSKELFEKCDVVLISVPLTKQTKHLINADTFNNHKKYNSIISISRYDIINWDDIANNEIYFDNIVLDCLPNEYTLLKQTNIISSDIGIKRMQDKAKSIILSSHIAAYSLETLSNIAVEIEGYSNNYWNIMNYNKAYRYKQQMKQLEYNLVPQIFNEKNQYKKKVALRKYIELQL